MHLLRTAIFALRSLGIRKLVIILSASIQHLLIHRRFPRPAPRLDGFHPVGDLVDWNLKGGALHLQFERAELEMAFLSDRLLRLTWLPGTLPPPYAVTKPEVEVVETQVEETSHEILYKTGSLSTLIHKDGRVEYLSPEGRCLREDPPPVRSGESWQYRSRLEPDTRVHGLGERAAPLDLRGGEYSLWNTDPGGSYGSGDDPLYMSIPVLVNLSRTGCSLLFLENCFPGKAVIGDQLTVHFAEGSLRYYLAFGKPAELLEDYTALTGRPPLPPEWALGFHQSRWGYLSESDIREVAAGFKEHDLPLSAIHLDIDYMDGYRVFTIDANRFPELSVMAHDLKGEGIRLVAILDPGVKVDPGFQVYRSGRDHGFFCTLPTGQEYRGVVWPGWTVFPDFTNPEVRRWWGGFYEDLTRQGIDGFWHDMNEPTSFSLLGDTTFPDPVQHSLEGETGNHRAAHNLYGLQMNRAGFEALAESRPGLRPWLLSRSGWAGLQRYAWHWTGDIESSWEALRLTIPMVLNLGLSGIPYSGPDIGGFSGAPGPELFTRWFQLGAFMPFFRVHSAAGTPRREPWQFGEPTLSICREFLQLRYRMIGYLKELAETAHRTGAPLARPMFWGNVEATELWDLEDQFMLGDDLLVAPVLTAGMRERRVILPPGRWVNLWNSEERWEGLKEITCNTPMHSIPAFLREGSIPHLDLI